ncbi:MAG: hypothetical protein U9R25_17440, partial [Chloroflexota bacterium]|nr:hypothetical protein [Chloroflexota bacterium]
MKLSTQDADLFYGLMWSLLNYANLKLGIFPDIATGDEYNNLPPSQKLSVRDALYDNIELVDAYLEENPQELSQEEREIVRSWKKFVRGDFYIKRLLKKYAVFIGDENVYAVLALHDSFEDMLAFTRLPCYAKAVLLPFKNKIVYDGILQG